jgi:hypothetical protein
MKKKPHGGKRPGAGRKKGSGQGRQILAKTISMGKASWELLERLRGPKPRGRFIESLLAAEKPEGEAVEAENHDPAHQQDQQEKRVGRTIHRAIVR